jgi:predicted MPP superfamily phosphohydrolase
MRLLLILLVLNGLLFWALWKRVKAVWPNHPSRARLTLAAVYWPPLIPTFLLPYWVAPLWLSLPSIVFQFAMLCFGIWLVVFSFPGQGLAVLWQKLRPGEVNEARRLLLKRAALAPPIALVVASAGGAVGALAQPVIRRIGLQTPRDMTSLHGLRIVQFSDVHIGRLMPQGHLTHIVEATNGLDPDIVVCTGDLLDHDMEQLEQAQELLRGVKHRHGLFMCLGNHEYYAAGEKMDELIAGVEDAGCVLLRDQNRKIPVGRDHLWVLGIDYPGRRQSPAMFDHALEGVADDDAPRIVLAHNPSCFWEGRERPIDLMLSGHTHGGQVSLGRIGELEISPVLLVEKYHAGQYEHEGRKLYVNSGTGHWMPIRVNCPPEITVIELV